MPVPMQAERGARRTLAKKATTRTFWKLSRCRENTVNGWGIWGRSSVSFRQVDNTHSSSWRGACGGPEVWSAGGPMPRGRTTLPLVQPIVPMLRGVPGDDPARLFQPEVETSH
jgi:hypothetical protein